MHYCKYALLQIHIIVIYIVISKYKKYLLGIINNEESRSDTQFTLVGQFLLCKLNLMRINWFVIKIIFFSNIMDQNH